MMARTTVNDRNQAGAPEAPAPSPEGDDVKVDIEVEGDEKPEQTADAQQEEPQAVEAEVIEPDDAEGNAAADADEDGERARVEAAIKAGEAAAEQDFKSEADGLRAERDELAKKLASVSDDIEAAKAEAAASADRLSRLQADWENYRRRTERDRVTERERACEGLVKDLLPAIDDLERAIARPGVCRGQRRCPTARRRRLRRAREGSLGAREAGRRGHRPRRPAVRPDGPPGRRTRGEPRRVR